MYLVSIELLKHSDSFLMWKTEGYVTMEHRLTNLLFLLLFFFISYVLLFSIVLYHRCLLHRVGASRESVGELKKAVETLACLFSHNISRSPKFSFMFLQLDSNTENMFSISFRKYCVAKKKINLFTLII